MVDITPLVAANRQVIASYAPGGFKISGVVWRTGVIVFPSRTIAWISTLPQNLEGKDFEPLNPFMHEVEVLLLGCGKTAIFPDPALKAFFKGQGISLDATDTGAACRTYNVLMAEGRRVAAAMIPMPIKPL